ncbi:ESPR-type extended signal peptide-containing protein [Pseudomonas sp. Pseusp97]|uniref:ESPR-type extended signal peptide-containing protein n=1 Tax=Pseudomonas sp. Pseusp97 TaxID=3243065 RepID=UPI0039A6A33E
MNKVYRVIWSNVHRAWVVVSEMSNRNGKGCRAEQRSLDTLERVGGPGAAGVEMIVARLRPLAGRISGALAAVLLGLSSVDMAEAGSVTTLGGGTYDNANTDYYQYSYRIGGYTPTRGWDNQYALGSYVSIGVYASTKVNKADDAIFKLDGYNANGRGGGVAVGDSSSVVGETGVALGAHSQALRNFSMALGGNSLANGLGSIATGREANALGNYSIAHGFVATASGTGSIGMGQSSTASGLRSIAIGTSSQLSASGSTAADATVLAQAASASGTDAVSIGTGATSAADASLALGNGAAATGAATRGVALGNSAKVSATSGVAIGDGSQAAAANALSIGAGNQVSGAGSVALGNGNQVQGDASAVIGNNNAVAAGQSDVFALGNNIVGSLGNSVALGSNSTLSASADSSTAGMGTYTGTSLGGNAYSFAGAAPVGVVSMGAQGAERRVQHVAAGLLSSGSTDAVNGSQLFATNQQTTLNSNDIVSLDSRMTGAETGIGNLDTRVTGTEGRLAVNSASIESLDGRVANVESDGAGFASQIGVLQQDALQWNAALGAFDASHGGATEQRITNVAAGQLDAGSSDAVNGSQLHATNEQVASNTSGITSLDGRLATAEQGLGGLGGRVTAVEGEVAGHSSSIGSLDGRMSSVEGGVAGLDDRLGTLAGDVAGHTGSITSLDGRLSNAESGVAANAGDIATLQQHALQWSAAIDAFDASHASGQAQKISNVAAAELSAQSTDAVNGGQLFATNEQVSGNAASITSLDGRVTSVEGGVDSLDGRVSTIEGGIAGNSDSITSLDGRMSATESDVATNTGDIASLQQNALQWNSTVGAFDASHGSGQAQKITNVAAAELSAQSTDAVNGGQLFATNEQVASNTASITGLDGRVSTVEGSVVDLDGRVGTIEGGIAGNSDSIVNLDGRVSSVESGVSDLDGRMTTAEDNIIGIQGGMASLADRIGSIFEAGTRYFRSNSTGPDAQAVGQDSIAIGSGAVASHGGSIALGAGSRADGSTLDNSAYMVGGAASGEVNLGERRVTGLAAGAEDSDAVNVAQLKAVADSAASSAIADAVQYDGGAHDRITLSGAVYDSGTGKGGSRITNLARGESDSDAVNMAQLKETHVRIDGIDSRVSNIEGSITSINNGGGIKYVRTQSSKADAAASGVDSVAIGPQAQASGNGSLAMGDNAVASADGSVAIGRGATDGGRGAESYTGRYSGAANSSAGTLSVGNAAIGETRTISNVADGKESTDAVNLRQLDGAVAESKAYTDSSVKAINSMNADVGNRVNAVEADVNKVRNGTDGMFQVNNTSELAKPAATGKNSVAGGAGAAASGDGSTALGQNAKASGRNSVAVGANSVAERDNSVAVGSRGAERQITHVAAATQNTDAVNLGQMNQAIANITNDANAYTDKRYSALKRDMDRMDDQLSAGIAGAVAIASLPQPIGNGGSTTAVGMGAFNGQAAVSVGVSHISNDGKWSTKAGGSTDTQGTFTLGVGVGYNW